MQEDYSDYSDFEIIALDPSVNYETSDDDDDDESEMQYEDTVVWNDNNNKMYMEDKTSDLETELSDQRVTEEETMCIENNHEEEEEESLVVKDDVTNEDEPMQLVENVCANVKPRKKLNLAEYKIRRANKPQSPVEKFDKNVVLELCEIPDSLPILELPTDPRSIKNLLEGNQTQKEDQPEEDQNLDENNSEIKIENNIQAQSRRFRCTPRRMGMIISTS